MRASDIIATIHPSGKISLSVCLRYTITSFLFCDRLLTKRHLDLERLLNININIVRYQPVMCVCL